MKYQKNNNNILLNIKNIINFIVIHVLIFFDAFVAIFKSFSFLIDKIFFSDKDNNFNIILITAETIEEYNN